MSDETKEKVPMLLWVVALQQNEAFKKIMANLERELQTMQNDFFSSDGGSDDPILKARIRGWAEVIDKIKRDMANTLHN